MGRSEAYKRIKIAGMLSFIPFVLVGGIFSGYFLGEFAVSKFSLPSWVMALFIGLGIMAAVMESARIIRLVLNIDKKA